MRLPPMAPPLAVVVTDDEPERPNRRATDGGPQDSPRARQRRLVRMIAGDPALMAWLATSKARTLSNVAAHLARAGQREAAEAVQREAVRLATGDVSPL